MPKNNKKNEYNLYICTSCKFEPEFNSISEIRNHLIDIHKINDKNIKGARFFIMHINAGEFHISKYKWEIEGIIIIEESCVKASIGFVFL